MKTIKDFAFVKTHNAVRMFVNPTTYNGDFSIEGNRIEESNEIKHYITSPVCFFLSKNVIVTKDGSIYHLSDMSEEYKRFIK